MHTIRGTDAEVLCQLEYMGALGGNNPTGLRLEVVGCEPLEIQVKDNVLHIKESPQNVFARACAWMLIHDQVPDMQLIFVDVPVAPYLERALTRVCRLSAPTLHVKFQVSACSGAESASIVRCMQTMTTAALSVNRQIDVSIVHHDCACIDVRHQLHPKLWALVTRDFYNICRHGRNSVIHEFQSPECEISFVTECHRLVPNDNWCTISPYRITFATGFEKNALLQHTQFWAPTNWRGGRILQLRLNVQETTHPYFVELVPMHGVVSAEAFLHYRCSKESLALAYKMLEGRAWAEGVTFEITDELSLLENLSVRASKLQIKVNKGGPSLKRAMLVADTNRNTIETLGLEFIKANISGNIADQIHSNLREIPHLRHLAITSERPADALQVVQSLNRQLKHDKLRELTLTVSKHSANSFANLFARDSSDLPCLTHLHLILEADLMPSQIAALFADYTRHDTFRRLRGVAVTMKHTNQRTAVVGLIDRFCVNLSHLQSLAVHTQYIDRVEQTISLESMTEVEREMELAIFKKISEQCFCLELEHLMIDTPCPLDLLLQLFQSLMTANSEASRQGQALKLQLRTLHLNVQMVRSLPSTGATDERALFLKALMSFRNTLRHLKLNADFVDLCRDKQENLFTTIQALQLRSIDVTNSLFQHALLKMINEKATMHQPVSNSLSATFHFIL